MKCRSRAKPRLDVLSEDFERGKAGQAVSDGGALTNGADKFVGPPLVSSKNINRLIELVRHKPSCFKEPLVVCFSLLSKFLFSFLSASNTKAVRYIQIPGRRSPRPFAYSLSLANLNYSTR